MNQTENPKGSYRDLLVWKKAIALAKNLYHATHSFPTTERYGLNSQIRRAAISVASNIAEGQARDSTKEFIHFLHFAKGSLAELDTQCIISLELEYLTNEVYQNIYDDIAELQRMIHSLIQKLKRK
jgi:four helix bundle protein